MEIRLDLATDGDTVYLICAAWSIVHDIRSGKVPSLEQVADDLEVMLTQWGSGVRNEDQAIALLIERIKELQKGKA